MRNRKPSDSAYGTHVALKNAADFQQPSERGAAKSKARGRISKGHCPNQPTNQPIKEGNFTAKQHMVPHNAGHTQGVSSKRVTPTIQLLRLPRIIVFGKLSWN